MRRTGESRTAITANGLGIAEVQEIELRQPRLTKAEIYILMLMNCT